MGQIIGTRKRKYRLRKRLQQGMNNNYEKSFGVTEVCMHAQNIAMFNLMSYILTHV